IKKYYDKLINSYKPFYTFEFEGHHGTVVERLKDRGIIDIKGDKVVLLSKDKLKALRDGLEKVELQRIDRNKKELTLNWLRYGVSIQIEPSDKSIIKNTKKMQRIELDENCPSSNIRQQ
ncbi:MAG: hypothetical protein L6244_06475, partial [Candidatus Methanoperedenaceae archaeon]|nr:hypothetical protein [Candidatus Methanoperedenaceae archaeon]